MAQLDSASDSDSDGWRFESVWVRHSKTFAFCKGLFFGDRKQRQIKRIAFEFVARSGHTTGEIFSKSLLTVSSLNEIPTVCHLSILNTSPVSTMVPS